MGCPSANTRNPVPGMLSAPGMVPASASSRDRTSMSWVLPEAMSERSSEYETVGTEKEDTKELRLGDHQTPVACAPSLEASEPGGVVCEDRSHTPTLLSPQTTLSGGPAYTTSPPHPGYPHVLLRYLQSWCQQQQQQLCDGDAGRQPEASPLPP